MNRLRWTVVALIALAWAGTAGAAEPQLFLSWNAPYGEPRATDTITIDCADSTRTDTLYLSFDPGQDGEKFYGMYARLWFHPAPGDTLDRYWHWERGSWNMGNLRMEFDPDGTFPCPQPWTHSGMGQPLYEFTPSAGKLDMVYAVRESDTSPVRGGTKYCFARVMFRQRKCSLPGARSPVCIEWAEARFSFGKGDIRATLGPQRFVAVNSPAGPVCADYRRGIPKAWAPQKFYPKPALRDTTDAPTLVAPGQPGSSAPDSSKAGTPKLPDDTPGAGKPKKKP